MEPPDISIPRYKLSKGVIIKPGDTVELEDHSSQRVGAMHSGDFFRIKFIIMNLETDQVRLRGHRMQRTKYLGQILKWKTNELAMVLRIDEDDHRPILIAGMEEVEIQEVIRLRDCALTNKPSGLSRIMCPISMSNKEIKRQIFHGGQLTCRTLVVYYIRPATGKSYSGVVRQLYANEADKNSTNSTSEVNKEEFATREPRARSVSAELEILDTPLKLRASRTIKRAKYIYADAFCGAGGASQGALQAGYTIGSAFDFNHTALETYLLNHGSAQIYQMNAHDFTPENVSRKDWKTDVLHLSPPCSYWSPAHTRDGTNDQENYDSIYTIGPILKIVRPRIATLEQTSGLATSQEHRGNFLMLLGDIGEAGYDIRYKIQDLSELGLAQKRRRLLIIAARRGTPLPSFPGPTHGPEGSGLVPYTNIRRALRNLNRHPDRLTNDVYHQQRFFSEPKLPYSIHSQLRGCITTGGTRSYHPSGLRNFTARELALLQSFPLKYRFAGSTTEVKKQVGNAFPPLAAEALFREIAKTLEAFDSGLTDAEEDQSNLNLDELLRLNNHQIRPRDDFNAGFDPESRGASGVGGARSSFSSSTAFSRHQDKKPASKRSVPNDTDEVINLLDDDDDDDDDVGVIDLLDNDDDGIIDLRDDDDDDEGVIDLRDDNNDDGGVIDLRDDDGEADDDDIEFIGVRESHSYF